MLLFILTCIVFWPLVIGTFSLKNDAYVYFLPWRYHISETIQHGEFPFWSPYLYTGTPLYSDMQSGTWNPVVLIVSIFTRYSMQVLQWELLFYIFIAGAGMYKLVKELGYISATAFITALSYICCGYMTDNGSFIPWITCAAYLPFVFLYFLRVLKSPRLTDCIKLSLSLFLLLTAGYPSYLIYVSYILLAGYIYWLIKSRHDKKLIFSCTKFLFISGLLFLALSSPVLLSFYDFLPYYQRGTGATIQQAMADPFSPFCSLSYLLPSAVIKPHPWIDTDIAMRNGSIGIFMLAFFFITLTKRLSPIQKFILGVTIFSFLFSLGDYTPLRKWCYYLLPLMDSFRHPAIIRVFTTIGLLLLAAGGVNFFLTEKENIRKKTKKFLLVLGLFITSLVCYYLLSGFSIKKIMQNGSGFKNILDGLTMGDIAVIQGIIQLFFITAFLVFIKKKKFVFILMASNVILLAWMALPFTFVSQFSTNTIDNYIHSFPKGFPKPGLHEPVESHYKEDSSNAAYAINFFFDKKIVIQEDIYTPTVSTDYHSYLSNRSLRDSMSKVPFAFISTPDHFRDSTATINLNEFSASGFNFTITTITPGYFNLIQQYNHNWKVAVNKQPIKVEKSLITFMKVPVQAGSSIVEFKYDPGKTIKLMMISSFIILLLLILLLVLPHRFKKNI
ncbi:MAG: hypothetical protein WDN26_09085 [Chitinophagaceae bacterium]